MGGYAWMETGCEICREPRGGEAYCKDCGAKTVEIGYFDTKWDEEEEYEKAILSWKLELLNKNTGGNKMAYIKPNTAPANSFSTSNTTQNTWGNKPQQTTSAPAQQTQTRKPGLIYTGVFTGMQLKNQGTISSGKRQGQPWTLLKLSFAKQENGGIRNTNISAFTPLSSKGLQPEQLSIGKEYNVYYNEKPYENEYGPQVGKQAYMIQNSVQLQPAAATVPQQQQNTLNQQSNIQNPRSAVAPEHQQLWDNNNFGSKEEWMRIAEDSGLFNSEQEAERVWRMLSGE